MDSAVLAGTVVATVVWYQFAPRIRSWLWAESAFTEKTVAGVTVYDLTDPSSS